MRKIFQKDAQNAITVLGRTEEHPHFYEGTLLAIDDQHYRIAEIREQDLGKPLYVEPVVLNDMVSNSVSVTLCCPYCSTVLSEGLMGYAHDTIVDCDTCAGVSHVQRLMDCKIQLEDTSEQAIDILYVIIPKIAGAVITIAVTE